MNASNPSNKKNQTTTLSAAQIDLIESYIEPVNQIALTAGNAIIAVYDNHLTANVTRKSDNSPVTDADIAADKIIQSELKKLTPDIPILSEESLPDWQTRQHWSTYWLVDPLDGTREFIKRNGEFTVNIALIINGRPVLGVIFAPAKNLLYWGANQQAWRSIDGNHERISPKTNSPFYVSVSRSHRCNKIDEYLNTLSDYEIKTVGSSLKFCWLAEGEIQLYPRANSISIWDIAAGEAIVLASGANMTDWQGNTIDYSPKESFAAPPFKAWFGDVLR